MWTWEASSEGRFGKLLMFPSHLHELLCVLIPQVLLLQPPIQEAATHFRAGEDIHFPVCSLQFKLTDSVQAMYASLHTGRKFGWGIQVLWKNHYWNLLRQGHPSSLPGVLTRASMVIPVCDWDRRMGRQCKHALQKDYKISGKAMAFETCESFIRFCGTGCIVNWLLPAFACIWVAAIWVQLIYSSG